MPKLFEKGHAKIGGMCKGDKHTEESKEKIRLSKAGKKLSKEHRENIGRAHKGMKRPASLGKRLSALYKGKTNHHTAGAKSHFWKGGITPINQAIRTSATYKNWRNSVYERDNYTCQMCGVRGGRLEADHIKPFSEFPELRFEISNGRTLCRPCHSTTDTYAHKQRWKIKGIIKP